MPALNIEWIRSSCLSCISRDVVSQGQGGIQGVFQAANMAHVIDWSFSVEVCVVLSFLLCFVLYLGSVWSWSCTSPSTKRSFFCPIPIHSHTCCHFSMWWGVGVVISSPLTVISLHGDVFLLVFSENCHCYLFNFTLHFIFSSHLLTSARPLLYWQDSLAYRK